MDRYIDHKLIIKANELLKKGSFEYAFCGGFAIELFLNRTIRKHGDIDVSAYWHDRDKIILYMQSLGWNVYEMCGDGIAHHITNVKFQIKAKRNIFCLKPGCSLVKLTPHGDIDMYYLDFEHSGQTKLNFIEFLFNSRTTDSFLYARNESISLPITKAIFTRDGIPYLAPELILLYKSTDTEREDYQLDYDSAKAEMSAEQRCWLQAALKAMNPSGHKWLDRNALYKDSLPVVLQERLIGYTCTQNSVGMSTADVYMFQREEERLFLKSDSCKDKLRREHDVLCSLEGKLPVPHVTMWYEDAEKAYLLITAVDGVMCCSCDEDILTPPVKNTVKLLAEGLKMLQALEIIGCPFENKLEQKLTEALYNIENNLVDMDDFQKGNEFATPMELYQYLVLHKPPEELCFAHGDYCLPNIIINGEQVSGFIDIGNAGIADKWQDIALCVRSLGYNLFLAGREGEKDSCISYLFECLGVEPNWDKINYYILLDELF